MRFLPKIQIGACPEKIRPSPLIIRFTLMQHDSSRTVLASLYRPPQSGTGLHFLGKAAIDLLVIGIVFVAAFVTAYLLNAAEAIHRIARRYEHMQLDEILLAMLFLPIVFAFFSFRRWREAQAENAEIKHAQATLRQVMTGARCLLWHAAVEEHDGELTWDLWMSDEEAAQRWLPIARDAGRTFSESWHQAKHADDQQRMHELSTACICGGKSHYSQEFRCVLADGGQRWLREDVQMEAAGQSRWHLVGVCTDITERKQAEEATKLREWAIESSSNGITIADATQPDLPFVYVNPAFERITGYSAEEVLGQNGRFLYGEDDDQPALMDLRNAFREGRECTVVLRNYHKNGTLFWNELHTSFIYDDAGNRTHFLGIQTDITERKRAEEALSYSEALHHSLVESLPLSVFRKDCEGRFTFVNGRFCNDLGKPRAEILGKTDFDFFPAELAEKYRQDDDYVLETGGVWESTEEHSRPGGQSTYVQVLKTPIQDAAGGVIGTQTIFWDITERRHAEEALRQSEERYRRLFEDSPIGIYRTNPDGRILLANPMLIRLLGYNSFEELAQRNLETQEPDASYPRALFKERIEREGEIRGLEAVWNKRDGTPIFVYENARAIRGQDGAVAYYEGTVEDVTERKRAEEALRESEKRYERMATNAPGMVYQFVLCADGSIEWPFISEGCRDVYGFRPEEIQQNPTLLIDIIHPDDRPGFDRSVAESAATLLPWKWEGCVLLPSGEQKWIQGASRPERQANGSVLWDGLLLDITERKRAEEETKQLQAKVMQAEKLAALGELVAGVAHEINNPLAAISGHVQLLEMHGDSQVREDAETIKRMTDRVTRIVRSLLTFARGHGGERYAMTLPPLVDAALEMCNYKLNKAGIELEVRHADELPCVRVNDTQIQQVILNLVTNAEHALRSNPEKDRRILIATAVQERQGTPWAMLSVTDNGDGVPEELLGRIFDPFFTTKDVGEGTGLGLSICHGIAETHGGELSVKSAAGIGTTFTLALPMPADTSGTQEKRN